MSQLRSALRQYGVSLLWVLGAALLPAVGGNHIPLSPRPGEAD